LRLLWARYSPEKMASDLVRTLTRISGAATEIPLLSQEIMDDLRKGRLEVRTRDPMLPVSVDVLGRRTYSGMVVGSMLIGSAILLAAESWWLGAAFFLGGTGWGSLHILWALWLGRRRRRVQ
jgi:hypothetical protein